MADSSDPRPHLDDFAADDDDDTNIPPHLHVDDQKRQDFIHRMNQVHIGGHQADLSNSSANTNANATSETQNNTTHNQVDGEDDNNNPTEHNDTNHESSNTNPHNSSSNANDANPAILTDNPSAHSSSNLNQSNSNASNTNNPTSAKPSSSATKLSASSQDKMNRYGSSGFPKYKDDRVLTAVSVPPSEQFPVRDEMIGPHHFKRLRMLGRGGIGQVFLVRLKDTEKLYAMKVLTKEEMIHRNKVKRVMTEREILATANHPFIVTMYASFQTSDRLCFVMEYCEGGEFFKVLQRQPKKRLKEEAVKFYAAEVVLALEYLHHMGFIYRDLKPENILMRANGHIALTDFDLSKQAHAVSPRVIQQQLSISDKIKKTLSIKRNNSSLTSLEIVNSEPVLPYQTNSFVGTEEYIAPEVVNGVGQSSAVDWWTLGILIYEMLTGTTPFKGSYTDETFNNIVHEQLKWPDDINVSNECKQLVKKLLKREADKRLGAENGASDIKRCKWFKDFNFALIRNKTPPIIPKRDPKDIASKNQEQDDDEHYNNAGISSSYHEEKNPENPFVNFYTRRNESSQRKY